MKTNNWLNKEEYPFQTKTAIIDGYTMNYVDEGEGDVILFVHGTPCWSFVYRKVIKKLNIKYRCIAPDHLGFGLSEKSKNIDYSPQAHAKRLKDFIKELKIKNFHLVVHDFGGPIGLSCAIDMPEKIKSITILNTWLWPLDDYAHFAKPSKIIKTGIGKFLYLNLNFSAKVLVKKGFHNSKNINKSIHKHYIKAQNKNGRKAAYQFALSLLGESGWYAKLWENKDKIQNIPTRILWGMEDELLPANLLLDKWREGFSKAKVTEIKDCGHFIQEEKPEFVAEAITGY
ncbi:MAG: alpha/beta fold hydrolase [Spirochaetia bacterium]|nr:alpha/beta fold hydrolase [Spirochaetia bacterium]